MTSRVTEHAERLVDYCTTIGEGDMVTIVADEPANDLLVELYRAIGRRGGEPVTVLGVPNVAGGFSDARGRAHLLGADGDLHTPEHLHELVQVSDVILMIRSDSNLSALSDVPTAMTQARSKTFEPVMQTILTETEQWCTTQHPTTAWAQEAGMSLAAYQDFVYDAMLQDWEAIAQEQEPLRERMDAADELRIVTSDTDVTMSLEGMVAVPDDARHNLPGGEVFTAPVVDSVEGEVVFDLPVIAQGVEIEDARLVFESGEVVEYDAATNGAVLGGLLDTDEGASRVGEVGIGTNGAIDRFTRNMLFDEKLSGTAHLALGRAYPISVGEDREVNESAVHLDMLIDTSEGRIELDGEPIQENGEFVFEEEHLTA